MICATFWETMGLRSEQTPILALIMMIAFGLNVAGLIFSVSERKKDKRKSLIGLIGHLILIIGFFSLSGYALMTMN